jgi:hypothetical protein
MQFTEILNLLLEFLLSPIFLFALVMIVCVGAVRYTTRSKRKVVQELRRIGVDQGDVLVKQMGRMIIDIEKESEISPPKVKTRQELITKVFDSQLNAIGIEPSTDSGYVPVSYTPLARFLIDRGVSDDTVGAILDGLMEEASEESVREIIDAAADTPDVDLTGEELEKAKQLAVDEWNNLRRPIAS